MKNPKTLLYITIFIAAYFLFLALNAYIFLIQNTFLTVVQELITLPLLLLQLVICINAALKLNRSGSGLGYHIGIFSVSLANSGVALGSIFLSFFH